MTEISQRLLVSFRAAARNHHPLTRNLGQKREVTAPVVKCFQLVIKIVMGQRRLEVNIIEGVWRKKRVFASALTLTLTLFW
jgi:hypothetical protein